MDREITAQRPRMNELVDWRAAITSGFIAGTVFLLAEMAGRALVVGGSVWITIRYIAAIVLGEDILPPPPTFDLGALIVALLVHFALALIFTFIVVAVVHEMAMPSWAIVSLLFILTILGIGFYAYSVYLPDGFIPAWEDVLADNAEQLANVILAAFVLFLISSLFLIYFIPSAEIRSGLVVGGLLGLALYAINYYTFTRFFPWFFPVRNWTDVVSHILFGALAGGVYEALEVKRFVPED